MARRLEITVPVEYAQLVEECLDDPKRVGLGDSSEKPGLYVQLPGVKHHIFVLTIPGAQVGSILDNLKQIGVGTGIGQIVLQTVDCKKPGFKKAPPKKVKKTTENGHFADIEDGSKEIKHSTSTAAMGFRDFQKARLTTEEIYNNILNGANMTINTWFNLVGACLIAGGGLTTNAVVFIVAAMLVSPIMGPILGMTFGYRIADWKLFKLGFVNCVKMTVVAFVCGLGLGLLLGGSHETYGWPTNAMIVRKSQLFNLVVSIVVSGAAGMVLGVSVTSGGVNSLVGTAISAGLLPPIVNAGMLISYGFTYAAIEDRDDMFAMAQYALSFFFSHVVVIFIVANFVFYLKEINPHFKTDDDEAFEDLPTVKEYKKRMEDGQVHGGKSKGFLVENLAQEFDTIKDKVDNFSHAHPITDIIPMVKAPFEHVRDKLHLHRTRSRQGSMMQSHNENSGRGPSVSFSQVEIDDEAKNGYIRANDSASDVSSVKNPVLQKGDFVDNAV